MIYTHNKSQKGGPHTQGQNKPNQGFDTCVPKRAQPTLCQGSRRRFSRFGSEEGILAVGLGIQFQELRERRHVAARHPAGLVHLS